MCDNQYLLDWTCLHYAAREGFEDIAAVLIENGADVNARSLVRRVSCKENICHVQDVLVFNYSNKTCEPNRVFLNQVFIQIDHLADFGVNITAKINDLKHPVIQEKNHTELLMMNAITILSIEMTYQFLEAIICVELAKQFLNFVQTETATGTQIDNILPSFILTITRLCASAMLN